MNDSLVVQELFSWEPETPPSPLETITELPLAPSCMNIRIIKGVGGAWADVIFVEKMGKYNN
jgi:hypothetical protein